MSPVHNHDDDVFRPPTCDACRATRKHRWSGWPGAWCLDCGLEDAVELAVAGEPDDVHHRYSDIPHTAAPCEGCSSDAEGCPKPPVAVSVSDTTPPQVPPEVGP